MPGRRIAEVIATALIVVAAAACGGGNPAATAPDEQLSIEEAIASNAEGPVTVRGYIVAPAGQTTMLCSALLESYPPQCGGPSLIVEGIDLSRIEALTGTNDPSLAQVQWSDREVSLLGSVEDGTFVVGQPSS